MPSIKVENVKRHPGIAGQFAVSCDVTYEAERSRHHVFVGSVYGGPVAYTFETTTGDHTSGFVAAPERFGEFGTEWVTRFFLDD